MFISISDLKIKKKVKIVNILIINGITHNCLIYLYVQT
jgi:hypothetical protein